MVNSGEFIGRLEKVMRYYDLSASAFADRIKVQRSSISHILSGRNKPSLEFVLKTIQAFPEINLYWLLKGKGGFPSGATPKAIATPKTIVAPSTPTPTSKPDPDPGKAMEKIVTGVSGKEIEKILVLYTDGSFKSYTA